MSFHRFTRAFAVALIMTSVACSKKSSPAAASPTQNEANAAVVDSAKLFPEEKAAQGIKFENIPAGKYKLELVGASVTHSSTKSPDWQAAQVLSTPGTFARGNSTARKVNWKGNDKGLENGKYLYSFIEYNLPLDLTATGSATTPSQSIYYFQKVRTDFDRLEWAADTGDIDNRDDGTHYITMLKAEDFKDGVYSYTDGDTSKAVILSSKDGKIDFYFKIDIAGTDNSETRLVHLRYVPVK